MNQGQLGKIGAKITGATGGNKVDSISPATANRDAKPAAPGETVELTSSAKLLERLEKTLAGLPEVDSQRVESIKTSISNGEYQIDANKIAEKLLRSDQER